MTVGSEFKADFSNNSPLVVANFHGTSAQYITETSFLTSNQKLNFGGRNYSYQRPFIDGPLINDSRLF